MCAGDTLAFIIVQKPFVYQYITDGGNRNAGADIICKEQDNLAKQRRGCDLLLPSASFSLQNIADYDCGIDAIKKCQHLFLLQTNISNAGHPAEAHIGSENLSQLIAFIVFIEYLFAKPAKRTLRFTNIKTMKIEKFAERERQHFDFYAPSGEIGGILRRKKIGIRPGNIDIAIKVHTESVYCIFPCFDSLQLVKEKVHPLSGDDALFHISVDIVSTHLMKIKGLKIHLDNLLRQNTGILQMLNHQL